MSEAVTARLFSGLVPLNALRIDSQSTLAVKSLLLEVEAGSPIFEIGETADRALYLIAGAAQLFDAGGKALGLVRAGEPAAAHRLAHQSPRKLRCVAAEPSKILSIDAALLDTMLTWDQTGSFEVDELTAEDDAGGDWMMRLLQMPTFQAVPPANLQAMFMRLEQFNVEPGHVVLKQGDPGDYFYVVVEGRCVVTREQPNQKPLHLAELDVGSCFGEEALISDAPRNATITMLTRGKLMRLSKKDFQQLLNEPLARRIGWAEAKGLLAEQKAVLLDVRMPSEVQAQPLKDAINIPLFMLRMRLNLLNTQNRYVVVCDSGRRSSVAVFVLTQKGYDAAVLEGGVGAVKL